MILTPDLYSKATVSALLEAVAEGYIGLDQRFMRAILDRGPSAADEIAAFASEDRSNTLIDVDPLLADLFRALKAPEGLPFLIGYYLDGQTDPEEGIVDAIAAIGEPAVPAVIEALDETEDPRLLFLLAGLRIRDRRVLDRLTAGLKADPWDASINIALHGDPAAKPAVEAAIAALNPASEFYSQTLQALQSTLKELENPVETHVEPHDVYDAYPEEEGPDFGLLDLEQIEPFLKSTYAPYRAGAVAIYEGEELTPIMKKRILTMAQSDPDVTVRASAWESLSSVVDEKPVYKAIAAKLAEEKAPKLERVACLIALAQADDKSPVDDHFATFYEDDETRASALKALWRTLDKDYAPFFSKHLEDDDPAVKRQAILGSGYMGLASEASRIARNFEDGEFRDVALFAYSLCLPGEVSREKIKVMFAKIDKAAGGLDSDEVMAVESALDQRLMMNGIEPVFEAEREEAHERDRGEGHVHGPDCNHEPAPAAQPVKAEPKVGRNDPCPCGSGKKYKKCHGA